MQRLVDLSPVTWQALENIVACEGGSVDALIRDAIKRDLFRRARAKKAVRSDERLVAPLRALLADDLAYARDWADLQDRLMNKGFELRESGGGLALHSHDTGAKLCKASDLGYSLSRLSRRFGALFPGHGHSYLANRFSLDVAP
jgi:hypothetical protein